MAAPKPISHDPLAAPVDLHLIRASDELLAEAAAILACPDEQISDELFEQARKKLWRAVTSRLKLFADARNWDYCEDGIAFRLVGRIDDALEPNPPQLSSRFACAERVYDGGWSLTDELDPDEVRYLMPTIQTLCTLLDDAHRTLPLDLTPPTDQYYRAAAKRCAERRAGRTEAAVD